MSWWRRLLHRRRLERELDRELRFHLEQHAEELIAEGCDPAEARRRARLDLGGLEQVKERARDARGTRWLEDLGHDVGFALRTLRRQPGFAAVALCTLALGIGATTIMFTVVHGVLLAPLPFPDPGSLLSLQEKTEQATEFGDLWAFAYPNFRDVEAGSRTMAMAAWRYWGGLVTGPGEVEYVDGREISHQLFSVLQVPLAEGRAFLPEEDRPGADPVVILGHGLWERQFGGDPAAIGGAVTFDGRPHTVVGIAPAGFRWFGDVDLFFPLGQNPAANLRNRQAHPRIGVVARLRPGATLAEAHAELTSIGRDLAEAYPASNEGRSFVADPLRPDTGDAGATLWLLLGAASLVLLIACTNVASLLLARSFARRRELGMRMALGAGRGRLIRQCLTESAVLGLAGCVLGVWLAAAGLRPFVALWPGGLPRAEEVGLDGGVLLFAITVSLASGLLFGLAPALRVVAHGREPELRLGSRSETARSRRLYGRFVIAEVALALVLLVAAGMLGNTLLHLSSLDPGLDVDNVLIARMALSPVTLQDPARIRAAWDDLLERALSVPGVESITAVDTVPMRAGNNQLAYWPESALPPAEEQPLALATSVTPDYLQVMGLPLLKGRFFDDRDRLDSEPVVVIDEVLAQRAFGAEEAVGRPLWVPAMGPNALRIVGVVRHVRYWGLAGDDRADVRAQLYYPFAQLPDPLVRRWSELMSIAVRTGLEPTSLIQPLRRELQRTGTDQALYEVRTMSQLAAGSIAPQRFLFQLFSTFAALALALACIGVYGVLSYVTGQRTREVGLRMALGASRWGVMGMVLGQSLRLVAAGVVLGVAGALGVARLLERLVAGVERTEPGTLIVMIFLLGAAAALASMLPARRAARVDPMMALRRD